MRAPETSIVPIALDIYNATRATATSSPQITSTMIAASTVGLGSDQSIATSRLNVGRDQVPDAGEHDDGEPSPFDFNALFTPTPQMESEGVDEVDDEETEDHEKPKRDSLLSAMRSSNGSRVAELAQVGVLAVIVAAVLVFVGVRANQSDPHVETPLAFEDQPGFPTKASLSIPDLTRRLKPVLFDLKPNSCISAPVAVAIDRERLIAPSNAVEPSQTVRVKFKGQEVTGRVLGGTRSADLALIVLDQRLDIDASDIPPLAGPLELDATEAAVYTDGKFRFVDASGTKPGWAGPDQGMKLKGDVAHGTFAFLPSGRLAGMVSHRPEESSIVQSNAAISDSLSRILNDAGDDFGCTTSLEAGLGPVYGDAQWGGDEKNRPESRVLEPLAERCAEKDYVSCDRLRHVAPYNSEYIDVARTCGGKRETDLRGLGCNPTFGVYGTRDIAEPFVGACLVLPRTDRENGVISDCFAPHDAEVIAVGPTAEKCMPATTSANTKLYWDRDLQVGSIQTPKNDLVACFLYDPGFTLTEALPEV